MEFLRLTYFCSAAETENFAQTAKIYNVPATSISQSIKRLENEIGHKLFDRTSNGVKLNEQDKILYQSAKKALSLMRAAENRINDTEKIEGAIKLLVMSSRLLVNEAINLFSKKYKNVSFYVDQISRDVNDTYERYDKYDLIISDNFPRIEVYAEKILVTDKLVLAVHKDNPLSKKENISIADLKNERFAVLEFKSGLYYLTRIACQNAGFVPKIALQSDDPYAVRECIERGTGISIIPSISWQNVFSENICLIDCFDIKKNTYIIYDSQKAMSKTVKCFYDILRDVGRKYTERDILKNEGAGAKCTDHAKQTKCLKPSF